ncbi:DUF4118 domain-containing protein [Streptomyces sp. P38-E01]|uniref:histidine kinase n=1 Tax=Streptomyces tardus TaxID=2780544 RepID=A0A949JHR1_9ACTN|nr:ATP-binding protein [Streptomyces tardus]MBU7600353.1 DUF4118 domain-containing protein [Streptomyces tardus]
MAQRGTLRVYLGAAPGVGKTHAMLSEGHRRAARGTDVVVGCVEAYGRPRTEAQLDGLEVLPRVGGAEGAEMDTDAVLRRAPSVVLIDELAHTNAPDSRHEKRWQDIEELLEAGIDVISTVNIQHLESLGDVVESITGVREPESVPDEVVRRAEQVELVDMTPQALRRRMAHGNVYSPEKVDAALSNYFRPGNLTALRELALLWTADRADEYLLQYRSEHSIRTTWQARERIVIALTGGPEGRTLIRRAARMAAKASGSELLAVYIARSDGLTAASPKELALQRTLVENLGGTFHHVIGDDIPAALLDFARGVNATQIVLGSSRRKSWQYIFGPGVGATVASESGPDLDVHIVTHEEVARGRGLPVAHGALLSTSRVFSGWVVAVAVPLLLTLLLTELDPTVGFTNTVLLFLAVSVVAGFLGGVLPALASAALCSALLHRYFVEPVNSWRIAESQYVITIASFFAASAAVALVVNFALRRARQAARLRAESQILAMLAGGVLRGGDSLEALLGQVKETFAMEAVALLERTEEHGPWTCAGSVGTPAGGQPLTRPEDGEADMPVGDQMMLVLSGRVLPASDRRVLAAFAAQAVGVLDRQRLQREADQARTLAEGNRIRTALLAAVSHDLRTPLAAIKAAVTSLRSDDVAWSPEDEADLLEAIEDGADRLDHLVGNLLDMSRLQTGTVTPLIRRTNLDEVVPKALSGVPEGSVRLDIPEWLPLVAVDPGLLERSVANIVENAVKYSPSQTPVKVSASVLRDRLEIRVTDRGPGVPDSEKERIFEPFQRLGDAPRGAGVGLGLAVARGFAEAMGGSLEAEDTPGGGMTMVLTLRTGGDSPLTYADLAEEARAAQEAAPAGGGTGVGVAGGGLAGGGGPAGSGPAPGVAPTGDAATSTMPTGTPAATATGTDSSTSAREAAE